MSDQFECPKCGCSYRREKRRVGKAVICACGHRFLLPPPEGQLPSTTVPPMSSQAHPRPPRPRVPPISRTSSTRRQAPSVRSDESPSTSASLSIRSACGPSSAPSSATNWPSSLTGDQPRSRTRESSGPVASPGRRQLHSPPPPTVGGGGNCGDPQATTPTLAKNTTATCLAEQQSNPASPLVLREISGPIAILLCQALQLAGEARRPAIPADPKNGLKLGVGAAGFREPAV